MRAAAGDRREAAVVVLEADPQRVKKAQAEYLLEQHPFPPGWTGREVEIARRELLREGGHVFERVTLGCAALGEESDVWFDVTRAGPNLPRRPGEAAPARRRPARAARVIVHVFAFVVAAIAALLLVL